MNAQPTRRNILAMAGLMGASVAFGCTIPRHSSAAGSRDPRLIVIILRGALDGLSAVPAIGDPDYAGLRGALAPKDPLTLDGHFALHPALVNLQRQYKAGNAAIIHACATAYRDRSHFDGQDVLESGYPTPGHTDSGWMNRLLEVLPSGGRARVSGVAGGNLTPLVMRGKAEVLGWSPSVLNDADSDLTPRLMDLYQQTDPLLARVLDEAVRTGRIASGEGAKVATGSLADPKTMQALAQGVARLVAADDGPRIAAMALEGWDTHAGEVQRLDLLLAGLDNSMAAIETEMGAKWKDTAVLVMTEFGRTARINGTLGSDHGTGMAAFATGGAVKGGRVIADWPGLSANRLYQGRDLNPTTDLRGICKGVIAGLYDMPESALNRLFPGSESVKLIPGLVT